MKASKENNVYTIEKMLKKRYKKNKYDIYGDVDSVPAYGKEKNVPCEEHEKVMKEYYDLLKRYKELKTKSFLKKKKRKQIKKEKE